MAGAGVFSGPMTGALTGAFAPIVPRRMGLQNADGYLVVRPDAITIAYVPSTYSQSATRAAMPHQSSELKVETLPNCPRHNQFCGFEEGMTVLIFDDEGHFDFFTLAQVQHDTGHVQRRQQSPSYGYQVGAVVTQAETRTYYYDAASLQLRQYDGYLTDVPVADNVVGVGFEYFGDPRPPMLPKPKQGTANCLYDAAGNPVGLPTLVAQGGSLAPLPLSMLSDGPWCGDGHNRYDADLLRVRKVRVTMRVQASAAQFRGTGPEFESPGFNRSALRHLPDYTVRFEVSPRNMNLDR
jgi:hypothetical protein